MRHRSFPDGNSLLISSRSAIRTRGQNSLIIAFIFIYLLEIDGRAVNFTFASYLLTFTILHSDDSFSLKIKNDFNYTELIREIK